MKWLLLYDHLFLVQPLSEFLHQLRKMDVDFSDIQMEQGQTIDEDVRAFIATLHVKQRINHGLLMSKMRKIDGVVYLEDL